MHWTASEQVSCNTVNKRELTFESRSKKLHSHTGMLHHGRQHRHCHHDAERNGQGICVAGNDYDTTLSLWSKRGISNIRSYSQVSPAFVRQ